MKFLLVISLLVSGCATFKPPVQKEIVKSAVITKDFDKTWASIVKVFSSKNITFKSMDKTSGLITTDAKVFNPFSNGGYIDCGNLSGMSPTMEKGQASYNILVEKEGANTRVTMNLKAVMITSTAGLYASGSVERECYSTGSLEKELFDAIK